MHLKIIIKVAVLPLILLGISYYGFYYISDFFASGSYYYAQRYTVAGSMDSILNDLSNRGILCRPPAKWGYNDSVYQKIKNNNAEFKITLHEPNGDPYIYFCFLRRIGDAGTEIGLHYVVDSINQLRGDYDVGYIINSKKVSRKVNRYWRGNFEKMFLDGLGKTWKAEPDIFAIFR